MEKTVSFEKSLKELEEIVVQLEKGELSLEQSLDYFQKGVKLSKSCSKLLDDAEQRVSILINGKDGEMAEQPFAVDDASGV